MCTVWQWHCECMWLENRRFINCWLLQKSWINNRLIHFIFLMYYVLMIFYFLHVVGYQNVALYFVLACTIYSRLWNKRTPWNNRSPPSWKILHHNFNTFLHQSRHCGHFWIFFVFKNFQKLISVPLCLFRSLEYLVQIFGSVRIC